MADPYIGQISAYAFNFSPRGWVYCSGQLLSTTQLASVFSLLGTAFGGNGIDTFRAPDLRARSPIGSLDMGSAPGLQSYPRGAKGGNQHISLSTANLPQHNHNATFTPTSESPIKVTVKASTEDATADAPSSGAYLAKTNAPGGGPDKDEHIYNSAPQKASLVDLGGVEVSGGGATSGSVTIGNTGFGSQFSIQNPMCNVNFAMAMIGTYPSRS